MTGRVPLLFLAIAWLGVPCPARGQAPSLFVSFARNVGAGDSLPENRLQFGSRWRPCFAGGRVCAQVGAMLIEEDFARIARPFRQMRHFGVGGDAGSRRWRVGFSVGQFDQHTTEAQRRYYRFMALSFERKGALNVLVEPQLWQFDVAGVGTPIHELRAVVRWRFAMLDIQRTTSRNVARPYDHWTATASLAIRPFQVRAGTQSVPDAAEGANRNRPVWLTQVGLFWATR